MTLMRTIAGINKGWAPAQRTVNQVHRCIAAGLADGADQPSLFEAGSVKRFGANAYR